MPMDAHELGMELALEATAIPICNCGDCTIEVRENASHYELVSSGGETTMAFHNPTVTCQNDDCEVSEVECGGVRQTWVENPNRSVTDQLSTNP